MKIYKHAGLWARLCAYLVDRIAVALIYGLIGLLCYTISFLERIAFSLPLVGLFWIAAVLFAHWLYYAVLQSSPLQATLGMKMLGLVIIDEEGKKISFARASLRYFAQLLCYLTLGIGFLMITFTKRKQGLHDYIASTYIVWRARSEIATEI